jgi:hypothetical protein
MRLFEVHLLRLPRAAHHQHMSGALRHITHLDRTRVFGLWDAMSPWKNFSNRIVDAEGKPAVEPPGKSSAKGNRVDHERRRR